jgi:outer membrane receptor protein involved in Fe transport
MPVPDAVVAIKKLNKHSVTDEKGRFKISGVKYGKHEVEVLSIEIKKQSIPIEVKNNMKPLTLVVEPSSFDLNEVVVSANTQKKELEIKGFAVNVIEPQKIAVQSIQTNELLDRTAGVRIRQDGGLGSRVKYNINGLSGEAIKIFIDGVPASNYGPAFSLSSIPPALIERIEVYKGVVPGHLAEDALGGAINIILKQRRTNSLTTSYSFGSFNTHQWNAAGSHRWDNGLTFEGSAFYNYSDNDYKVWGKDIEFREYTGTIIESNGKKVRRFHDAYESYGGKFDIGFTNVKWADQLMIGTILSQNHQDMQNGATMQVVYGDRNSKRKSEVFTLKYNKADFLLKGLTFKVDASYSFLEWQVIDTVGIMYDWAGPVRYPDGSYVRYTSGAESGNAKTVAKNNDEALMARGSLSYRIHENHTIFANLLYNDFQRKVSDKYQPEALQKLRNTRDLQKNVMAFTYENLGFSGKLRTNLFYKHYFQKVTANEPHYDTTEKQYKINTTDRKVDHGSYGFTLSFALLTDLYLLGSAERALRLPSADELFGNGSDNSLQAIGLKPERSWNVNVGFSYHYQLKEHSFGINSSVYFRDTEDMIRESIQEGRNEYTQAENLEAVLTKGFDAELTYHYADKLNVRFNVSKFDVLFNTKYNEQGHPYNYYRMQIRNEPSFKYNGQATYFLKNLFMKDSYSSIYFNINHVNGFYRNWSNVGSKNRDYIQAQYPVDLGLTYTFPKNKFALSFDIKNIFDEQIFDNYGLQKPGRAFYAKITYFIF